MHSHLPLYLQPANLNRFLRWPRKAIPRCIIQSISKMDISTPNTQWSLACTHYGFCDHFLHVHVLILWGAAPRACTTDISISHFPWHTVEGSILLGTHSVAKTQRLSRSWPGPGITHPASGSDTVRFKCSSQQNSLDIGRQLGQSKCRCGIPVLYCWIAG